MEYLLSTDCLTKKFKRQTAIDNISLHIRQGEIYGLIGKNGAGKTTFLKMISGLSKPTSGDITFFGYHGAERNKVISRIGVLIEAPGLYPDMSAYDNLKLKCICVGLHRPGYIENILSIVVIAGIFSAIYQPTNGILNTFLGMIGLDFLQQQWMGNPDIINYSIIAALIWQAIGYYMVMYMSSMTSIPENLYEAASLEGAGKVKQFFMITLPLIWDNIRTTLTFFVISTINLSFMFVQLTSEGNLGSEVALNYMYNNAFAGKYGFGMAIGVCIFVFSFALSAIINKVTEREVLQY